MRADYNCCKYAEVSAPKIDALWPNLQMLYEGRLQKVTGVTSQFFNKMQR